METILKQILIKLTELLTEVKLENLRCDKDREDIKNILERISKR